jgi:hypothetical protein
MSLASPRPAGSPSATGSQYDDWNYSEQLCCCMYVYRMRKKYLATQLAMVMALCHRSSSESGSTPHSAISRLFYCINPCILPFLGFDLKTTDPQ